MAYPPIAPVPAPPLLDDSEQEFDVKAVRFNLALPPLAQQINAMGAWMQEIADEVESRASDAEDAAARAESAVNIVESSANFRGNWSSLTGALGVPSSVYHNGSYWQLLSNLTDVTASEPGVSEDWASTATLQGKATGPIDMSGFKFDANTVSMSRYDVSSAAPSGTNITLDLSERQVFEITTTELTTLNFINIPDTGKAETVVVDVAGNHGVAFTVPEGITLTWDGGSAPDIADVWTQFVFISTGSRFRGGKGYSG